MQRIIKTQEEAEKESIAWGFEVEVGDTILSGNPIHEGTPLYNYIESCTEEEKEDFCSYLSHRVMKKLDKQYSDGMICANDDEIQGEKVFTDEEYENFISGLTLEE